MPLAALYSLYQDLLKSGKVPAEGWSPQSASREICLRSDGTLERIVDIRDIPESGQPRARTMTLPNWGSATGSGIRADAMSGMSGYVLGLSGRGTTEQRVKSMQNTFLELHRKMLSGIDDIRARALLRFLEDVKNKTALPDATIEELKNDKTALISDRYVFSVDGEYLHEIPEFQDAWNKYYSDCNTDDAITGQCLVTGEIGPIAVKHPQIRNLRGAQSSGAGLSNYNIQSLTTFGLEQNTNAPVSKNVAYRYVAALDYLLANKKYRYQFGEKLTVVWWPEGGDESYGDLLSMAFFSDDDNKWTDSDIANTFLNLSKGRPINNLDPNRNFYIMGLSSNTSRIIIRFFEKNTFGNIAKNISNHYERLALNNYKYKNGKRVTVGKALWAMSRKDPGKELSEKLIDNYFQSMFFDSPYPAQMLYTTMHRIKNDKITWERVSLIKAYFLKFLPDNDKRKEGFAMGLIENNREPGYIIGRLFALCEITQSIGRGNKPWDTAPIHGMFRSAMTTPGAIIPRAIQIIAPYTNRKECSWYAKQIREVAALMPGPYPTRLDTVQQGLFTIGYYQQLEAACHKNETKSANRKLT